MTRATTSGSRNRIPRSTFVDRKLTFLISVYDVCPSNGVTSSYMYRYNSYMYRYPSRRRRSLSHRLFSDFPRDDVMKKLSDFRRHTGPGRGEADFMSLLFWPHFPFPFKSPCRSLRAYLEHGTTTHQANYFGYPSISVRVVASSGCIC